MSFKNKVKQQSSYPAMLENIEKKRKRDWLLAKKSKNINNSFNALNSHRLQMFSGKRGK